ncbi:hypothetical protein CQB00_02050 [Klebsiella pneumoniae]|nr:hypothetical protein CPZ60_26280 [Klebsiella pneumoniae]PHZ77465.1 hypothetical protein CQB00_02050 [Klebsiella pneumoniae]
MSTECTFIIFYIIFCAIDAIFAFILARLKPVSSSLFQKSKYPRARHSNFSGIQTNLVREGANKFLI